MNLPEALFLRRPAGTLARLERQKMEGEKDAEAGRRAVLEWLALLEGMDRLERANDINN